MRKHDHPRLIGMVYGREGKGLLEGAKPLSEKEASDFSNKCAKMFGAIHVKHTPDELQEMLDRKVLPIVVIDYVDRIDPAPRIEDDKKRTKKEDV